MGSPQDLSWVFWKMRIGESGARTRSLTPSKTACQKLPFQNPHPFIASMSKEAPSSVAMVLAQCSKVASCC
ncbi:uncharacterized protein LODBEIA_P22920 [Lodderomyces beijingensis]|uniref:Uncharacterized protein n=1 Tax=Lodderomyces beijingensis TaxID=1775926 RepID=A0ABP0ZIU6_9ASCO